MEKNLPIFSFKIADKTYNNFVIPFLNKLDDGNVFRNIIVMLIKLAAYAVLIGGIIYSIFAMFGDGEFIDRNITRTGLDGGTVFGSVIGLLFGLIITLICVWFIYSVLKKRSEQISELPYDGLLKYVFITLMPKLLLLIGEVLFVSVLYLGVLQLIAALIGSFVYAPLIPLPRVAIELPGIDMIKSFFPIEVVGDYDNFIDSILSGIIVIVLSFILLVYFYILKEVYNYSVKLVVNLIKFLPRFAFPLSIRSKNDNSKVNTNQS